MVLVTRDQRQQCEIEVHLDQNLILFYTSPPSLLYPTAKSTRREARRGKERQRASANILRMYTHSRTPTQSRCKATLPSAMRLLSHWGLSVSTAVEPAHSATCNAREETCKRKARKGMNKLDHVLHCSEFASKHNLHTTPSLSHL